MSPPVPLLKFTPSAQDPAILEAITVQREPLVATLVEHARNVRGGRRHRLLVGPRGIGKTHVLSLVASRVADGGERADAPVIAWLVEDPWAIRTYDKFLAAIGASIAKATDDAELAARATALRSTAGKGDPSDGEQLLREAIGSRRLLLLVENLDAVFARIGADGQARFRAFAEDWAQLLIFATATQLFSGVRLHASPFYGFFAITHLDELSLDSATDLLRRIAELRRDARVLDFLGTETAARRLAAVEALAGGHPRVWLLLAGCTSVPAIEELVPLFLEALDDLTPYYQDRMRELGEQQQELVVLLAEAGGALSNRTLSERSGIAQNQVATILKQLADRGYVRRAELPEGLGAGDRRMSWWELREPLMRLCLDVKQSRGEPLRIVVEFLRAWYGPRLLDELDRLPTSATLAAAYAREAFRTLDEPLPLEELMHGSPAEIVARAERGLVLQPESFGLHTAKATGLLLQRRYAEARDQLEALVEREQSEVVRGAMVVLRELARGALGEPVDVAALDDAAEQLRREGLDNPGLPAILATTYDHAGRPEQARAAFAWAVEVRPDDASLQSRYGEVLARVGRHEQALAAHDAAIALEPERAEAHVNRGSVLTRLGQLDDARAAFARAVELDPSNGMAQAGHGLLLDAGGDAEAALAAYARAAELSKVPSSVHRRRGKLLVQLHRRQDAVEAFARAVELDPDDVGLLREQGLAFGMLGRHEEALEALTRTRELDPADGVNHALEGIGLAHLERTDEALAACRHAVALAPESHVCHGLCGVAFQSLGRREQTVDAFARAAELAPDVAAYREGLAGALLALERPEEAERAARRAIELADRSVAAHFTLGAALLMRGAVEGALEALRRSLARWNDDRAAAFGDTGALCRTLWLRIRARPARRAAIEQLVAVFADATSLDQLASGIVASIPLLLEADVGQRDVDAWVEDWTQARRAGLEVPLRMLAAAQAWKRDRDQAHLLALPPEQRRILIDLLPHAEA